MTLPPWRSPIAHALHRNRSLAHVRFLQLATVRANGYPANRTVVFRGFWGDTSLRFVTDARSAKADQIDHCKGGEACWYFTQTREQFRLTGTLTLVRAHHPDPVLQQVRQTTWQELSDAARTQFAWAEPGQPRSSDDGFVVALPDAIAPLPDFCLLLLNPTQVDHLELRGDPQNRWLYQWDGKRWDVQAVNP